MVTTICSAALTTSRDAAWRPVFGGAFVAHVPRCPDGTDAATVSIAFVGHSSFSPARQTTVPPADELPDDPTVTLLPLVRDVPVLPWKPGITTGILLFGLVPFVLGYAAVRALMLSRRQCPQGPPDSVT